MWRDGWMALCRLHPDAAAALSPAAMVPFADLTWELYDHRNDPAECHDLAVQHPAKLRELQDLWWAAAGRFDVLPIDTRPRSKRWPANPPLPVGADRDVTVFVGRGGPHERGVAPRVAGRSFRIEAEVNVVERGCSHGVLYALGGVHGGYCWYILDDEMRLEVAQSSVQTQSVGAAVELPVGAHVLAVDVSAAPDLTGHVRFSVDGATIGGGHVSALLRRVPIGCGRTYVGHAPAATVTGAFRPPFEFEGVLERLTVSAQPASPTGGPTEMAGEMREQ